MGIVDDKLMAIAEPIMAEVKAGTDNLVASIGGLIAEQNKAVNMKRNVVVKMKDAKVYSCAATSIRFTIDDEGIHCFGPAYRGSFLSGPTNDDEVTYTEMCRILNHLNDYGLIELEDMDRLKDGAAYFGHDA